MLELKQAIEEFNAIKWDGISKENINEIIPWPLIALVSMTIALKLTGEYIYRSRPYHSFDFNTPEDNISIPQSFSYPPPPKARLNRANFEGEPVFYGSSNPLTSIIESRSIDSMNFVSAWKIISDEPVRILPYIANIPTEIQESDKMFIHRITKGFSTFLDSEPEKKEILMELNKFNDIQFTKKITQPQDYLYTAWLAYRVLFPYKNKPDLGDAYPEALMFQSTMNHNAGTNFAIHPQVADRVLQLESVYLITLVKGKLILLSCGYRQGEKIVWKTPSEEDNATFNFIHSDVKKS